MKGSGADVRQLLPPLAAISHSSSPSHRPPNKPLHIDLKENQVDFDHDLQHHEKSEDSVEPPITPGGSLSPAVDELIKSFRQQPFRTHRRTGSGGSLQGYMTHRRTGSNGSGSNSKQSTLESSVRKVSGSSTPILDPSRSSPAKQSQHTSLEHLPRHNASSGVIPYSKLDSSDSDSDPEIAEQDNTNHSVSTVEAFPSHLVQNPLTSRKRVSNSPSRNMRYPAGLPSTDDHKRVTLITSSNESSCEITGTDGHDADSESNNGETESTADERLPTKPTNFLSLSPPSTPNSLSPLPLSSSTSTPEPYGLSPLSSLAGPTIPHSETPTSRPPSPANSHHGQVAMLISQFEGSENNMTSLSNSETSLTGTQLEIPLHIRREQQLSGSYSPAKVEQALTVLHASGILNTTSIVRHYFENVSRGTTGGGLQRRYSTTELEDSGFQVRFQPLFASNFLVLFGFFSHVPCYILSSSLLPLSLPCPFCHSSSSFLLSLPPSLPSFLLPSLPPSLPPSISPSSSYST